MKNYNQLTLDQRYEIQAYLAAGFKKQTVAELLGVHPSTIYREINRNADRRGGGYRAELANRKAQQRHRSKEKRRKFDQEVQTNVEALLQEDYSPEQVAGTLKTQSQAWVSTERIYQHIWMDKKGGGKRYKHLRHQGKKYRKRGHLKDNRGLIANRLSIEKRPSIVDAKNRLGDVEVDTVIGKDHKGALVTINCRASGILKMEVVRTKSSEEVSKAMIATLEEWKPWLSTITSDNGKEFANHEQIAEELDVDFYFANPYHSWERGANENLNGLVRQYFPKGSDFSRITQKQVKEVERKLNARPRKRYNFKSPDQRMAELMNRTDLFALTT